MAKKLDRLHDEAFRHVEKFVKDSRDYSEPAYKRIRKNRKLYEAVNEPKREGDIPKRADLRLPIGFTTVESIKPTVVQAIVGEDPFIDIRPRSAEDDAFSDDIQAYIQWRLEAMKFRRKFIPFEHNREVDGTAIAIVPYRLLKRKVVRQRPAVDEAGNLVFDEMGMPVEESFKTYETIKDSPDFELIDALSFFPDPSATNCDVEEWSNGLAYEFWCSLPDLRKSGQYVNLDKLSARISDEKENGSVDNSNVIADATMRGFDYHRKYKNKIRCIAFWGPFNFTQDPSDGTKINESPEEAVIIICPDHNITIKCERNPFDDKFRPFIVTNWIARPNEVWGIGVLDKVESLIQEMQAIRNARLDLVGIQLNPPWEVMRDANINLRTLRFEKNAIWLSDVQGGAQPVRVPDNSAASYRDCAQIEYEIQNATAQINASQNASNVGQAFGSTAAGINFFQKYMADRIKLSVQLLEDDCIVPLAKILWRYAREYEQEGVASFRVSNREAKWRELPAEAMDKMVDFIPVGADRRITKGMMNQIMDRLLTTLGTIEGQRPNTIKWQPLISELMDSMGYKDPSKFTYSDDERQQMADQMRQQQLEDEQQQTMFAHQLEQDKQRASRDHMMEQQVHAKMIGQSLSHAQEMEKAEAGIAGDLVKASLNAALKGESDGSAKGGSDSGG